MNIRARVVFCLPCFHQIVAVLLPILIFLAFYYRRRDVYDLHHAILGTFFCFHVLPLSLLSNQVKREVSP